MLRIRSFCSGQRISGKLLPAHRHTHTQRRVLELRVFWVALWVLLQQCAGQGAMVLDGMRIIYTATAVGTDVVVCMVVVVG